jgi:hypothetical protein
MIKSSAGVVPDVGNETFTRPENPTQLTALMSSSGSDVIKLHALSSITKVQVPAVAAMLVTVSVMGVGVGK